MGAFFRPTGPSGSATAAFYSRYTFTYHLRIAACEGAVGGLFLLNEFVAKKALGASDLAVTLMFMLPMVSFLVPLFWKPPYRRGRVFLLVGVPGRALLIALLFIPGATPFLAVIILYSLIGFLLIPVQSHIIKVNYGQLRGHYFGLATTVSAFTTIAVALAAGWLLQQREDLYRFLYPAAGALGIFSYLMWSRLRKRAFETGGLRDAPGEANWRFRDVLTLWRGDGDFRRFETAFFIYGLGFMMLSLTVPLYLVERMQIGYSQAGIAKGLIFYAIMVFLSPLAGRLYDRVGHYRLAGYGFIVLGVFAASMLVSSRIAQVYVAFSLFGVAMTLINVVWNLGPVQMAPSGRERLYMSTHLALVGIRAGIGYPLGLAVKNLLSYEAVFIVVIALEAAAALMMIRLAGRSPKQASG